MISTNIIRFTLFSLISSAFLTLSPTKIFASTPITGTFVIPDISYQSEAEYRQFFQELKDTGIDTVILTMTGNLSKNCATGAYTETSNLSTVFAGSVQPWFPMATKLAKEYGMKIFFSIAEFNAPYECFTYHRGTVGDENTDKGRLIASSLRTIDNLKTMVTNLGISWNDPIIAGLYLSPEESTRLLSILDQQWGVVYPQFKFFKDLSFAVKQKEPSKKILHSSFQLEDTDYEMSKRAFTNLLGQTSIDIEAPQDSLGTNVTQSFGKSSDHYRALHDAAAKFPGKEGWANVETFSPGPTGDGFINFVPSNYSKVKQQITTVQPYVSKTITWTYQYTMLSNPLSDNVAARNIYAPQYTPSNAILRKQLRADYLAGYGGPVTPPASTCSPLYTYHISAKQCLATNSTYTSSQYQCDGSGQPTQGTCAANLASYPGITTGVCYTSQDECIKAGDLTGDSNTNATDYQKFLTYFQNKNISGDLNHDGTVDIFDYNILLAYYQ